MLGGRRRTFEAPGLDGTQRTWAVAPLLIGGRDRVGLVAVGFDLDAVLGNIDREMARDLVLLGILCIFVLLAGWCSGNAFIVRPIMAMVRVTRRIRDGDLDARAGARQARRLPARAAIDEMARR
jgi:hypothetical protein